MQLVENDEVETLRILDDGLVELILPGHQKFEHHEIRQRMSGLALLMRTRSSWLFLAGVPREGRSQVLRQSRLVEELDKFLSLAVGERVHRIDHDRTRALLVAGGACADRRIDDRYEEAEGFSRTGAGRDREALSRRSFRDSLHLMPVKGDRLPVDPKDVGHIRMERPVRTSASTEKPCLEMRIDA